MERYQVSMEFLADSEEEAIQVFEETRKKLETVDSKTGNGYLGKWMSYSRHKGQWYILKTYDRIGEIAEEKTYGGKKASGADNQQGRMTSA